VPEPLLEVRDLSVAFDTEHGIVWAVDAADLAIEASGTLGIVGESGSGKSVTALSVVRLVPRPGRVVSGSIRFDGEELLTASERRMNQLRGREIGFVFSDPMLSLNPVMTIEEQLTEAPKTHLGLRSAEARARARYVLERVGIADAPRRLRQYPHEFSGGMRQRVMIAMAIACDVRLLIADEPTTALDVTVQAAVVELLRDLQRDLGMAMILISHDLDLVAAVCDRVAVMYAGRVVEAGAAAGVVGRPRHPYTQGLLACNPHHGGTDGRLSIIPGAPSELNAPWKNCAFHPRCRLAVPECLAAPPVLTRLEAAEYVRCVVAASEAVGTESPVFPSSGAQ
jgi:oligopeptide/dipeptide ABC transporter ATP-binding protein